MIILICFFLWTLAFLIPEKKIFLIGIVLNLNINLRKVDICV